MQNNLKELWSLLNFLLPSIFTNWEQFESWFDFSDLQDEETTEDFLGDQMKQDLIKKIHLVLQPLLLRRIKADVEHMLPKKREYLLYAPMTDEQTDLYHVLSDKTADVRKYLEDKVVERLTGATNTPLVSRKASPTGSALKFSISKQEDTDSEDEKPLALRTRQAESPKSAPPKNAFQAMMSRNASISSNVSSRKRKSLEDLTASASKSAKSSKESTPARSIARGRGRPPKTPVDSPPSPAQSTKSSITSGLTGSPARGRGRPRKSTTELPSSPAQPVSTPRGKPRKSKGRKVYVEAEASEEDELSDDEFEQKIADELTKEDGEESGDDASPEEIQRTRTLELASKLRSILHKPTLTHHRERNFCQEAGESFDAAPSSL